jgi:hypothetical protein
VGKADVVGKPVGTSDGVLVGTLVLMPLLLFELFIFMLSGFRFFLLLWLLDFSLAGLRL